MPIEGWAVVAVPVLAVFLVGAVARDRTLPTTVRRLLLWLALIAAVLGLLRATMRYGTGFVAP